MFFANNSSIKYEIIIFWDDTDNLYIAEVPELPGCKAHGDSYDEALKNAKDAMALWLATAEEFGHDVPEPKGRKLMYA